MMTATKLRSAKQLQEFLVEALANHQGFMHDLRWVAISDNEEPLSAELYCSCDVSIWRIEEGETF